LDLGAAVNPEEGESIETQGCTKGDSNFQETY
jgi:hypothetical protein